MAIRFWGIWLVSLYYVIQQHSLHTISIEYIKSTILLSIVTLILPLWVLQKAISALGVNKASDIFYFSVPK